MREKQFSKSQHPLPVIRDTMEENNGIAIRFIRPKKPRLQDNSVGSFDGDFL